MPILAAWPSADSLLQWPRGKILSFMNQKHTFALVAVGCQLSGSEEHLGACRGEAPLQVCWGRGLSSRACAAVASKP